MMKLSVAVAVLALCLVGLKADRPSYIGCADSSECSPDSCCMLSQNRYSIPTCTPLQHTGRSCRPRNEPINTTVSYPNGDTVHLNNIYLNVCRCASELTCSLQTATCQRT